jgi:hypothetical protein
MFKTLGSPLNSTQEEEVEEQKLSYVINHSHEVMANPNEVHSPLVFQYP